MLLIAIFSSFSKELNSKAKHPKEGFLLFISRVLLNSVCGTIVGTMSYQILRQNIYLAVSFSAIGGLLGMNLIIVIMKIILAYIMQIKNIKISDIEKINLDDDEKKDEEDNK